MAEEQMQVDFTRIVNELANRLRILESKQSLLSEKLLVMNQNMVEEYKRVSKDLKAFNVQMKDLEKDLANVKNIVKHLTEETGQFARQSDVKALEKYINIWDPLQFVTEKEVQKLISAALKQHGATKDTNQRSARVPEERNEQ
ncbi:MAG TPA: hypothetical protein VJJ79_03325 [Candidatus Nanoarchaeia archaeon]|nr:hypothetical protein [Candidatus Nanoarchaeia archaeon]